MNKKYISAQTVFIVTFLVMGLTVLSVWLLGLGKNKTLFENSIVSISILSITFFLFLTISLYNGLKMKDDIGRITDKIQIGKTPDFSGALSPTDLPMIDTGDGVLGIILGILAWIVFSIALLFIIWIFGAVVWSIILVFVAMLYWIFFRAIRLTLKNSIRCKGNIMLSMRLGLFYTVLYSFWIYGIILGTHYLK
jgi:hypothetical protein